MVSSGNSSGRWILPLALVLILSAPPSRAASPPWFARAWQTDEGLPDHADVGIAQSPDGVLWVATQGGLVRFNGSEFRAVPPVTEAGTQSGLLHGLSVDSRGRIWVAKDGGTLVCVDQGRATWLTLASGSPNARAVTTVEDRDGNLWAAYPTRDSRLVRIRDGQPEYVGSNGGPTSGDPVQLARDGLGEVWCVAGESLSVLQDGRFERAGLAPGVQRIAGANSGGVWYGVGASVMRFTQSSGSSSAGSLPSTWPDIVVTALLEDRQGRLWVGTSNQGLFCGENGVFTPVAVSHREILCLAEDREQSIWVGTRGGGLNRLRPAVVESQEIASGLPFEAVRSVAMATDGVLWAVSRSGVVARRMDGQWSTLGPADGWSVDDAMSVAAHPAGGVWIGTHYHGLFHWRGGVRAVYNMEAGLAGNFARSLLPAPNGDLWIGTASAGGLHRLRDGALQRFSLPAGSGLVRAMATDGSGSVWAGTAGGVLVRVSNDQVVDETDGPVPRLQTIRCLHWTPDRSLWIGYGGSGVGRLKNGLFTRFADAQGVTDDYISQILDDGAGRLWFAGNKGIFCVPEREFAAQAAGEIPRVRPIFFGRDEGLPALQASREAWPGSARGPEGNLWIAMQTGLAVAHPSMLQPLPPPPVAIERVLVDGREAAALGLGAQPGSQAPPGPIQVGPGRGRVAFEFAALSFASPRNVQFRFMLEGLESDWVDAGARRVADYSPLPPGPYRFRVSASGQSGQWSEPAASVDIQVNPFWWQRGWFQALAAAAFLGLVGGLVRFAEIRRMKQRVERAEQERAVEQERSRIAQDIHDDLGASLTEITLLSELAQGANLSREMFQADMRRIASRTRHLTRSLDATVWAVNPRNDTLESLVTYACGHADEFLRAAGVRCRLELPDQIPGRRVSAPVRHNVFLVVKEALHNVVKHAAATEAAVRVAVDHAGFTLEIEDNGGGLHPPPGDGAPARRSGNGLLNMRKRAEAIGARFELRASPGQGVRLRLRVPFHHP